MKWPHKVRYRKNGPILARIYKPKAPDKDRLNPYPSYRVTWVVAGKRVTKAFQRFAGSGGAREFAEQIVKDLAQGSQAAALTSGEARSALAVRDALEAFRRETGITITPVQAITEYLASIRRLGKRPLSEAVAGFLSTVATVKQVDLAVAVNEFIAAREIKSKVREGKRAQEYILPAQFDATKLDGVPTTVGYISLSGKTPSQFGEIILQKLGREKIQEIKRNSKNRGSSRQVTETFEDDFSSGLGAWATPCPSSWTPKLSDQGVELLPHTALRRVLLLEKLPFFALGEIEGEVYLEHGGIFDLVVRGSCSSEEFYMARLDSRREWYDCFVYKPKSVTWDKWWICNWESTKLKHYSPSGRRILFKIIASKSSIRLYRDGELVDCVKQPELPLGRIAVFAEEAKVYLRKIAIRTKFPIFER